jgi:hypothetical protein
MAAGYLLDMRVYDVYDFLGTVGQRRQVCGGIVGNVEGQDEGAGAFCALPSICATR